MGSFIHIEKPKAPPNVGANTSSESENVVSNSQVKSGIFAKIKDFQLIVAALLVAGGIVFYKLYDANGTNPIPDGSFNVTKSASRYGRELLAGYGESCYAAAGAIRAGQSFDDAQALLRNSWKSKGEQSFVSIFGDHLNTICPEGTVPDAEQREKMAKFLEQLGDGVRK